MWNDGPKFPNTGIFASVVSSTPIDGCSSVEEPPTSNHTSIDGIPYITLKWAAAVSRFFFY